MDSNLLRKQVGALIKARRRQLKITQEDLAARIGVSRATLANIETGRQNLLLHHLYRFAAALDLKVTDLLPDSPVIQSGAEVDDLPLPANLSREQRAQIAHLLLGDAIADNQTEDEENASRKKTRSRKGSA